ncbi:MAG: cytochrome c3 family protein [Phycisphaerae bacterium]|nr:cytochrome c3 family protein [Phycisphaerae bacterium]
MRLLLTVLLLPLGLSPGAAVDRPASPESRPADPGGRVADLRRSLVGSKHDFTDVLGGAGTACSGCHVPHMMAVRPASQPAGSVPTTQPATIEIYRIAGQRRVFAVDRYTPGPTSLVCLGCHDGTVATSTMGSGHAMLAGVREGFAVPDTFVWRDHPIGVPYPNNRREYRAEAMVTAAGKIPLPDGRVECISCHDPHNQSGVDKMLVMSNRRSALCLACHVK